MMFRSVVVLSCGVLAHAANGSPFTKGSCKDDQAKSSTCCDVDDDNNGKCVHHVKWAMETGFKKHPHWYTIYGVEEASSFADYQCALFWISWNKDHQEEEEGFPTRKHSCPRPCSSDILNHCAEPPNSVDRKFNPATQDDTPKQQPNFKVETTCPLKIEPTGCDCGTVSVTVDGCTASTCKTDCPSSSIATWMIALLALLALALIAGLAYFFMSGTKEKKKPSKKKKRSVPAPPPAPEAAPEPAQPAAPQPVSFTMAPITTAIQQPMPMMQYVTTAAPAATMVTRAPPTTATMIAQQPVNLFDALDRNGDGVISRAEMAGMQSAPPVQTTAVPMVQYSAPAQPQAQYAVPAQQQVQYAMAQPMQYARP